MVFVTLGREGENQTFVVHRELLMLHSGFFRCLLIEQTKNQAKSEIMDEVKLKSEVKSEVKKDEDTAVKKEEAETAPTLDALSTNNLGLQEPKRQFLQLDGKSIHPDLSDDGNLGEDDSSMEDLDDLDSPVATAMSTKQRKPTSPTFTPIITQALTTLTTLTIPYIPAMKFRTFVAYLYTSQLPPYLTPETTTGNTFASLYLFATQLGSPGLMNHALTLHRRNLDQTSWPDSEQVQFIYDSLASYNALPLTRIIQLSSAVLPTPQLRSSNEEGREEIAQIAEEGKKILRRFTAACIAAQNPFERMREGAEGEEWTKLLGECEGLGLDVLMEGSKWVETKPWEECWRGKWVIKESEEEY